MGLTASVFQDVLNGVPHNASDSVKATATQTLLQLLDGGRVDVNETDASGCTPLYWACYSGLEAVALRLLDTGDVGVDAKDTRNGTTPLFWAC